MKYKILLRTGILSGSIFLASCLLANDAAPFIVNQVFIDEYLAVLAKTDNKKADKFLNDKASVPLWIRASFGYLSAEKIHVPTTNSAEVKDKLLVHAKILQAQKFNPSSDLTKLAALVPETFTTEAQKTSWAILAKNDQSKVPACEDEKADIKDFKKQKDPVKFIRKWESEKLVNFLHCLKIASAAENLPSPKPFLDRLRQVSATIYQNHNVQSFHALSLYEAREYAETLRLLVTLQESAPQYRLIYDMVQRIFSLNQLGKGEVALRPNL